MNFRKSAEGEARERVVCVFGGGGGGDFVFNCFHCVVLHVYLLQDSIVLLKKFFLRSKALIKFITSELNRLRLHRERMKKK